MPTAARIERGSGNVLGVRWPGVRGRVGMMAEMGPSPDWINVRAVPGPRKPHGHLLPSHVPTGRRCSPSPLKRRGQRQSEVGQG